jgi:hypothetical protein
MSRAWKRVSRWTAGGVTLVAVVLGGPHVGWRLTKKVLAI